VDRVIGTGKKDSVIPSEPDTGAVSTIPPRAKQIALAESSVVWIAWVRKPGSDGDFHQTRRACSRRLECEFPSSGKCRRLRVPIPLSHDFARKWSDSERALRVSQTWISQRQEIEKTDPLGCLPFCASPCKIPQEAKVKS